LKSGKPADANVIIGQAQFIKDPSKDVYESAGAGSSPDQISALAFLRGVGARA